MPRRERRLAWVGGSLAFCLFVCLGLFFVSPVLAATWVPEQQVNIDDDNDDWSPEVAIDTTGRAWIVWGGVDPVEGDEEICFRWWDQGAWGPQGVVNPPNAVGDRFPALCAGKSDGVPWCVWAGWNSGVGAYDFLVSHWLGDAWSWPETVFVGGERYDTYDIVAGDTSLVWVLWSARTTEPPTHKDVFARARVGGVWGDVEQIEIVVGHEGQVRADLDGNDRLWAVWQSDSLDYVVIQSCVRDESGWGEVVHVAPHYAVTPAVAIDDDGVAWVVWRRGDMGDGSHIMSARWEDGGWTHLGEINSVGGGGIGVYNPFIRNAPGSGPLVVWWGGKYVEGEAKDVYESKWTAYGWREQGCVSTPDSVSVAFDAYPGLAVDSDGRAWVCWMRAQRMPPYDYDIWCSYSDDVTPVYFARDLNAAALDGLVLLSWSVDYRGTFDVYRSLALESVAPDGQFRATADCSSIETILPEEAACVTSESVSGSGRLEYIDKEAKPGCQYTYWVVEQREGECRVYGPVHAALAPIAYRLSQSYPNPFNPVCTIRYELPHEGRVSLRIFGISGRLVRTLVDAHREAGSYSEVWDGRADDATELPSGVYFYRLEAGDFTTTQKAVLLK